MRRAVALTLLLLVVLGLWLLLTRRPSAPPTDGPNTSTVASGLPPPPTSAGSTRSLETANTPDLAATLNAADRTAADDLRLVSEIVDTFRTNFLATGNPTGTNAEITAALTGQNALRLVLISPQNPAINREGELCDRWGTPFFFHAESATRMDLRSAGPDRRMWTEDDVVYAP